MTESTPKRHKSSNLAIYLWLADLIAIWLTVVSLRLVYGGNPFSTGGRICLVIATVAYIPAAIYMKHGSTFQRVLTLDKAFINSFKIIIIHALCFMSLSAFLHLDYAISFYAVFYGILCIAFPIINLLAHWTIKRTRRKGHYTTRVAIVGTNTTSMRLRESMLKDAGYGYDVVGHFDANPLPDFKGKYLGDMESLREFAAKDKIDEIYFAIVGNKNEFMPQAVKIADDYMLNFLYVPMISRYVSGGFELHNIGSIPVLTLRKNPLSVMWKRGCKRAFDIAFSSLFLLFFPLILIPITIGIKMSSKGPIFFKQERTGYKGKSFKCYKFRTMRVNAEADKAQATADDPRKTKFGNFLRRTSLDELPQFINVWLGDMSVVGPRPHMLKHTEEYTALIDKYMVRHVVKPGITGWAQVHGFRGLTDELWKMEKRVEHDVWYIENWTFSLDLKIVFRTVLNALHGEKNAF